MVKNLLKIIAFTISLAYGFFAGYANLSYINIDPNNLDLSTKETAYLSVSNNLLCNSPQTNNSNSTIVSFKILRTNALNNFRSTITRSHEHIINSGTIQYLNLYLDIDIGSEEIKIIFPFHNFF